MTTGHRRAAGAWLCAALCFGGISAADPTISLHAKPIPLSDRADADERIGRLRFRGMLALPNVNVGKLRFAQLSALAWDDDDGVLYALADRGTLFHLQPILHDGTLTDVKLLKAVSLVDPKTSKPLKGLRGDTEGLDIQHGRNGRPGDAELIVSFERFPRIVRYRPDGTPIGDHALPPALKNIRAYRDSNKALESVCVDDDYGVLTLPEAPLKTSPTGVHSLYSTAGPVWGYPAENENRVVALECLGNGRLLVLERDYGRVLWRALVSLKLLQLGPDSTVPLPVESVATLDSGKGFQIDNFEGLARHRANTFFMISDDNDLFIQRTLLMYFELVDD